MNKMLITTAGLAEIRNAEQSGTAPVVLSHVAFGTGQYTATADMTKLKSEFKRFDSVAGGAIADNIIHLTVHDNSDDAYTVSEIGVFTDSGTLFAVYSATTPIMDKSAASETMLAIDIALTDIDPDSIAFGDTNIVLNPATTTTAGIVELATADEAKSGTDTTRAITPAAAKAARDADANIVHRSGNETIAGVKTFSNNPRIDKSAPMIGLMQAGVEKGTAPSEPVYAGIYIGDSTGYEAANRMAAISSEYSSDGSIKCKLVAFKPESGAWDNSTISIVYPASGDPYATAPTPAAGDNSTKIATTAWVNNKGKEFLPLAGGTMSGAIKSSGGDALVASSDSEYIRIAGGSLAEKGAEITLSGKDRTSSPGVFRVKAVSDNITIQLVGSPDGKLTWGDKNIVRSVNGTAADTAGNVSITSVASATKATQDGNGKVIADTYLAKSGGTLSGNITIQKETPQINLKSTAMDITSGSWAAGRNTIAWCMDKNGHESAGVYNTTDSGGTARMAMYVMSRKSGSQVQSTIGVSVNSSGVPFATAPNTPDGAGSNEIVTASWAKSKFLPLAGGTITGNINVQNAGVVFKDTQNAIKPTSDAWHKDQISFFDKNNTRVSYIQPMFMTDGSVEFRFAVSDPTNGNKYLNLGSNGIMRWDSKYVLNNSFQMTTDGGAIMLTAGTSSTGGAYLRLYGKDHSSGAGTFNIAASNGTTSKVLAGKADGTLTWNGKAVAVIAAMAKSKNGHIKIGDLIIQWGRVDNINGSSYTSVTLPTAFSHSDYAVVTSSSTGNGKGQDGMMFAYDKTTTNFKIDNSNGDYEDSAQWIAIGW